MFCKALRIGGALAFFAATFFTTAAAAETVDAETLDAPSPFVVPDAEGR